MKKLLLVKLVVLLLATATLSSCILVPRGVGHYHNGGHDNGNNKSHDNGHRGNSDHDRD